MAEQRLTPRMLRRALSLPAGDRAIMVRALQDSLRQTPEPIATMERLAEVMKDKTGLDVRDNSRRREVAWARCAFSLVAYQQGISQSDIARFTGRNHSSICLAIQRMGDAFENPSFYQQEVLMYNNFVKSL